MNTDAQCRRRAFTHQPKLVPTRSQVASPAASPATNVFAGVTEWNQKWAECTAAFTDRLLEIHNKDRWQSAQEERRTDRSIYRHLFQEAPPNCVTRSFQ